MNFVCFYLIFLLITYFKKVCLYTFFLKTILKEKILSNQFALLNNNLAPVEFDLTVNEPFYFQGFTNLTRRHVLKPKNKLKVFEIALIIYKKK